MPVQTIIQLRRDTASNWSNTSTKLGYGILYDGEIGFEKDTYRFKIGDGVTPWADLDYFGASGVVGSGIGGNGTQNYFPVFTNSVTVGNSILYQDVNNLVVGGTTSQAKLHVDGDLYLASGILDNSLSHGNNGQILSSTGSGLRWIDNTGGGSGSGTIDGSGTPSYITAWQDSNTITDSIIYQDGTNIGIGTNTPSHKLTVNGSFSATSKSFAIPHPSKKKGLLVYGSLESPYHGVRLTGKSVIKKGKAVVKLPKYIKDLVKEDEIAIQLTNYRHSKILFVDSIDISKNAFTIKVADSDPSENLEFFWDFTAIRKDIPDLVVEP